MNGSQDRSNEGVAPPVGFAAVDDAPNPAQMIAGMDAADRHEAVRALRVWAARELRLREGDRLIDVGCGAGTAAIALAAQVGTSGHVRGIDASSLMIAEARRRAAALGNVEFSVGDAVALAAEAESFDAYRSERTYQWLVSPELALHEGLRVLRPGGRMVIIDTDWGTLTVDHPDDQLSHRFHTVGLPVPPNRFSGRRLLNQFRRAGLVELDIAAETILATGWDPDRAAGVAGFPPFAIQAQGLVHFDVFTEAEAARWLATLDREARAERFFLSVTMFAVAGTKTSSS